MLEEDPGQVLSDQFMLPNNTINLIDCSPNSLFQLMDARQLAEVTQIELELGFRKMKEAFDRGNIDYKNYIFEIEASEENDDMHDADDVRLALS